MSTDRKHEARRARVGRAIVAGAGLLAAVWAGEARAGSENRMGTGGATELRIPVGARSVALGEANAGSVTGAEALFYNPAGIANSESGTEILFSYSRWLADMDHNFVGVTQKMGGLGVIGVSVKVLSVGEIERTTEQAPDGTGEVFSPTFAALGLSYGRQITDRVSFGGSAKYLSEHVLQENATGLVFDFGFQYDTDFRGIRLGFAMKNFGANPEFQGSDFGRNQPVSGDDPNASNRELSLSSAAFELPSTFQFGISYPAWHAPQGTLSLHGLYSSNSFNVDEGRVGVEYLYKEQFALRGGYLINSIDDDLFGLSYGAGVRLAMGGSHLWLDYAGQSVSDFFDDVQHVTVTFEF